MTRVDWLPLRAQLHTTKYCVCPDSVRTLRGVFHCERGTDPIHDLVFQMAEVCGHHWRHVSSLHATAFESDRVDVAMQHVCNKYPVSRFVHGFAIVLVRHRLPGDLD